MTEQQYNGGADGDLCSWCCCYMGDNFVKSDATDDAKFCSNSCLYEALMQFIDDEVEIIDDDLDVDGTIGDALLHCPRCGKNSRSESDKWSSEGMFEVPGKDGYRFSIMTCPQCGKSTPLVEVD